MALGVALALLLLAPTAGARDYRPLDAPGPNLRHSLDELRASLTCRGNLRHARRQPVLLLSATGVDPVENYSWNWMRALSRAGFVWCASEGPDPDNMADIQIRGEYVAYAIRRMYRRSGRRIAIYGHSQGGMVGRWALRFWPRTRRMVADVVAAAPSNRGTDSALFCALRCPPSVWQQRTGSQFITALNSGRETHRRVSYTNVYTRYDTVVTPNGDKHGRSALGGPGRVTNVATQDVCPASIADHLSVGTVDPITWALFRDAARRRGPARPARLPSDLCARSHMPGVNPRTVATDSAAAGAALATTSATAARTRSEPALRNYVLAR